MPTAPLTHASATDPLPPPPLVTVRGLGLARGGRTVLDAVDFELRAGEIVAVIGPNGAGKSTLLECLVGVRRADRGTVAVRGRAATRFAEFCAAFAFMPDEAAPPPELTVAEVLAHARRLARPDARLSEELVAGLGIAPLLGARAGALSRGERRRVALYGALCTARPVVVLDEPFGAFDPLQLREVLAVVRARARAGRAVVASVHQMSDAEKVADRVLLLAGGRVVAFGTLAALRAQAGCDGDGGSGGASLEAVFFALLERAQGGDARA